MEHFLQLLKENGYLILFILVFVQELGVPTISNELILLYFGYLCNQFFYSLTTAILIGVSADVLGSLILFSLFYLFSNYLSKSKLKLIKSIYIKIKLKKDESVFKNKYTYFIGRLIPFVRGYVSVFAGISKVSFHVYSFYLLISAVIFTGGLLFLGYLLGNHLESCINNFKNFSEHLKFLILILVLLFSVYSYCRKKLIRK